MSNIKREEKILESVKQIYHVWRICSFMRQDDITTTTTKKKPMKTNLIIFREILF